MVRVYLEWLSLLLLFVGLFGSVFFDFDTLLAGLFIAPMFIMLAIATWKK
jgi:hypothetical protein